MRTTQIVELMYSQMSFVFLGNPLRPPGGSPLKIWVQSMPLRNEYGMSGLGAPPTILGLLGHPQTLRNWTTHGLHRFRVSNLHLLEIYSKKVSLTSWFGVSEAVQYKWTSNSQYSILRGLETESAKSSLGFPNDLIEGHRFEKKIQIFFYIYKKI